MAHDTHQKLAGWLGIGNLSLLLMEREHQSIFMMRGLNWIPLQIIQEHFEMRVSPDWNLQCHLIFIEIHGYRGIEELAMKIEEGIPQNTLRFINRCCDEEAREMRKRLP